MRGGYIKIGGFMEAVKNQFGKTKYDLAIKIADDLNLASECKKEAGYRKTERGFLIPDNIQQVDKALDLYLERINKILDAINFG